jgi:outer membrane receptor protein involved in Fe transport
LLTDLAGSVANIKQTFFLNDSTDLRFASGSEQGGKTWDRAGKLRDLHQNEWSAFVKDEWKIQQNLTLNLGVRYEYYGVPWDRRGLLGHLVGGGTAGVFGISGTSFADMYQPGRMNGSLTLVEFVGKHSPNSKNNCTKTPGTISRRPWVSAGLCPGGAKIVRFFAPDME